MTNTTDDTTDLEVGSAALVPEAWGRLRRDVPLAPFTWFRVGGVADYVFEPASIQGLQAFMKARPVPGPYIPLGAGSNVLIRDGRLKGCVLFLPPDCGTITQPAPDRLEAGAKVLDKKLAKVACEKGLGGLAFLYTIPGTIGGALRMNAGAFGSDIAQVLTSATIMTPEGEIQHLPAADLGFAYRQCGLPEGTLFLSGQFKVSPQPPEEIRQVIDGLSAQRRASQPSGRTGGSTFKNPLPQKAWELIDKAGMRGAQVGEAEMSRHHCNFMINKGGARACDLEELGENVRKAVQKTSGVALVWEIVRLGSRV